MPEERKSKKRQIAYKQTIKKILSGDYTKEEDWNSSYVVIEDKQVSRVNIIGTITDAQSESSNYQNFLLDDGSGSISLRFFENFPQDVGIGDTVMIIGMIRDFNNERYIAPEIIKKIENKDWIQLRVLELNKRANKEKQPNIEVYDIEDEVVGENQGILSLIKQRDKGDGVDIAEIISKSKDQNAEKIIDSLLKNGEIFEVRPGKIKILA
jgi:RPA family protein